MKIHLHYFHTRDEANCFLSGVEFAERLQPNQDDCCLGTCPPRLQADLEDGEDFEDGEENSWIAAVSP